MEVQIAESGPCRRSLTITIPVERIKSHLDDVFKSASEQAKIKGFRPGRVPRRVLEQRYGTEILAEAKESLINRSFEEACQENEIAFIGRPEVEGIDDSPLDQESPLEFQVHVDIKPTVTLERVKGIEVTAQDTDVNDDDIKAGLDQLAEQKRSLQQVDEPVEEGDFVKADLLFKKGDELVHERKDSQLNTHIPVAGTDPEVFKNSLVGAEKDSVLTLELKFPDKFEKEEVRGEDGQVELHIHEVLRVTTPPIDDEFAKGFDFEDMAALRTELEKRIGEEKLQSNKNRIEQQVLDALTLENPFELPDTMVTNQRDHLLQQAEQEMKQRGMEEEAIVEELAKHKDEAAEEAERRVRVFFVLEAVARQEKIFVTESDMDVEFRAIASANSVSPDEVIKHYEENNLLGDLRLGLMERKVREFLRENAEITDK